MKHGVCSLLHLISGNFATHTPTILPFFLRTLILSIMIHFGAESPTLSPGIDVFPFPPPNQHSFPHPRLISPRLVLSHLSSVGSARLQLRDSFSA